MKKIVFSRKEKILFIKNKIDGKDIIVDLYKIVKSPQLAQCCHCVEIEPNDKYYITDNIIFENNEVLKRKIK